MTVVDTQTSLWGALAGRAPGEPTGPADPELWGAVTERLHPAKARPVLRAGIEAVDLVSVRDVPYVLLRSPDDRGASYLRLAPEEWRLARLMDGTRTVARLVAEFARISGRLAPEQVTRVVADLAGNRMLEELPVDVYRPADAEQRRRLGHGLLAALRGRRMVVANVDPLVGLLYRGGGRLLFTRPVAALLALVAAVGLGLFGWTWWQGSQPLFLLGGSYATGVVALLGLHVVALVGHELGHALATRHADRRVPAAGLFLYFGIPSVFVDTTDVWLAGRRARLTATAAGPAAGLVLAGAAQLVGLLVPAAAPWAFALAFVCYLNTLFNLSPLLALDGQYLLADWLEIPNLRARGVAYLLARLRRRPPAWGELDREGRLIALHGALCALWLLLAAALGWRLWTDRLAGLGTGLWPSGWPARLLFAAVVAGLTAPLAYLAAGWLARRGRRWLRRMRERRPTDALRRLEVLRRSALGRLPDERLAELAAAATWVRPRTGQHLLSAGTAHPWVYVVVSGALEGRQPGDPAGMVRERRGPGGVVGLASAVTGTPNGLTWHTAGTTLLAVPAELVASAVGRLPGLTPGEQTEVEALFDDTPALDGLPAEEKIGLTAQARPSTLEPGAPVVLPAAHAALIVGSGAVALADGTELRRGTMIGPMGYPVAEPVAHARTRVRLWTIPAVSGLPLLLGAAPATAAAEPSSSVVPRPPFVGPPGTPPSDVDEAVDRRFERSMWALAGSLALLVLTAGVTAAVPGPAWAEMPTDRAMLSAERGPVEVTLDGRTVTLRSGDRRYVPSGTRIDVPAGASGRLTFRGGAALILCPDTRADIGPVWSGRATLGVGSGRVLADTAATSGAFGALALTVHTTAGSVTNQGPAWFAVSGSSPASGTGASAGSAAGVDVSNGDVWAAGAGQRPTNQPLTCGDGVAVAPPAGTPSDSPPPSAPASTPSPTPPATTAPPVAATSAPVETPPAPTRPSTTTRAPTTAPTTPRPRPTTPRPRPTTPPPTSAPPTSSPPTSSPPPSATPTPAATPPS